MSVLGANKELWVTKSGEILDVDDMQENHAKNTLKMLIRQIREGRLTNLGYHQERINTARELENVDKEFESHKQKVLMEFREELRGIVGD